MCPPALGHLLLIPPPGPGLGNRHGAGEAGGREREFFIDNLLVRIHFINEMIWWTGLAPWEFEFPFPGSLTSTFLAGPGLGDRHGAGEAGGSAFGATKFTTQMLSYPHGGLQPFHRKSTCLHVVNFGGLCDANLVT